MRRHMWAWAALLIILGVSSALGAAPKSESFTLEIFGNANMDDIIDEKDVFYVNDIINRTTDATNFSDANYDGKVDSSDIDQIKKIIAGNETQITLVDTARRTVTVHEPVNRIIELSFTAPEVMRDLKLEKERVVGVSNYTLQKRTFFPEFASAPNVGDSSSPNYEQMIKLQPDLIILYAAGHSEDMDSIEKTIKKADPKIEMAGFGFNQPSIFIKEVRTLGYILGKSSEANEFIDFYNKGIGTVWDKTKDLPDEKKPRIYQELAYGHYRTSAGGHWSEERVTYAGGYNIFHNISGSTVDIDPEEVMKRNPEIIVAGTMSGGYDSDNISDLENVRKEIMNRSELSHTDAVKNGRVYVIAHKDFFYGASNFLAIAYMAKWFYPDLFKDLDPRAIHQEYLTRFQGLDFDANKHGTFVYPPMGVS